MPQIPYLAKHFNAYPPTSKVNPNSRGKTQQDRVLVSKTTVANYAIGVGSTGVFVGGRRRPLLEMIWRAALVLSSLKVTADHFVKSDAYERMDPSEKSAVSYFLGMVQCAVTADRVLGVRSTVHVDELNTLLGRRLPRRTRPDLVGYSTPPSSPHTPGRFLLEAKGRTGGFASSVVKSALDQLANPPQEVLQLVSQRAISVASLAYFKSAHQGGLETWHSHLEDPPTPDAEAPSELGNEEYCGLITVSQLLPVYQAMSRISELSEQFNITERSGLATIQLPLAGLSVGIPLKIHALLSTIDAPLRDKNARTRVALTAWEMVNDPTYLALDVEAASPEEEISVLSSGLTLFNLGQGEDIDT